MCLAIPVRVEELQQNNMALVDIGGIRKSVSVALLEDVAVGDYVVLHVGYALNKIDPAEAEKTLALFAAMGAGDETENTENGEPGSGASS